MTNETLSALIQAETRLWMCAIDHDHLQQMYRDRISKDTHDLTDQQTRAVTVVQAGALALACQQITLRAAQSTLSALQLFSQLKTI